MTQFLFQKPENPHFLGKKEMSKLTGLSGETLKKYRRTNLLTEGIHWVRVSPKLILYCVPLVLDWLQNQGDPVAHQRAIENYQATFLSNQNKSRSSNSKKVK